MSVCFLISLYLVLNYYLPIIIYLWTLLLSLTLQTIFPREIQGKTNSTANYGIRSVISHISSPDKSEKPIANASRSLTPAECYYGQIEKEALAIILAIKIFHKMLSGWDFTLVPVCKPLLVFLDTKKVSQFMQLIIYNIEPQYFWTSPSNISGMITLTRYIVKTQRYSLQAIRKLCYCYRIHGIRS